ncbi:hypothetical protein HMPREF3203_01499 [Proteus mirabilis]|nr:hypothetical protein HMPREF3203_01499 [Proteus mirabilis]
MYAYLFLTYSIFTMNKTNIHLEKMNEISIFSNHLIMTTLYYF